MTLSLGNVRVMARVTINGKQLETLWKRPFELDIMDIAKAGKNTLEIKVSNAHGNKASGPLGPVAVKAAVVSRVAR